MRARYVLAATGFLSAYQLPDIPGIDSFAGIATHTARWPRARQGPTHFAARMYRLLCPEWLLLRRWCLLCVRLVQESPYPGLTSQELSASCP